MKFIKKFTENNLHPILNIVDNIKDMLHTISDDFKTEFDWESDGLDAHKIIVFIHTKEFADEIDYDNIYVREYFNFLNFFTVAQSNKLDKSKENMNRLLNYHKDMIIIYENISVFLERLKQEYTNCFYLVEQENKNKSRIMIKINIPKDENK
jgi:hypothetical protein